jgi:hypothetical protein
VSRAGLEPATLCLKGIPISANCWQYVPGVRNTASRFVKCSTYNDVEEEKSPNE